jgi:nucleotide-binding universal stress UspA family protein
MKPKPPRILCGTDFSQNACSAADVAAAIAIRLQGKVQLVHVADQINSHAVAAAELRAFLRPVRARLIREAQRLGKTGLLVEPHLLHGKWAEEMILDFVRANPPDLVVLAAASKSAFDRWTIGSVSERVARQSAVPTLVVRAPERLLSWAHGESDLRVAVAFDFSASSDAALASAGQLGRIGPCRLGLIHAQRATSSLFLTKLNENDGSAAGETARRRTLMRDLRTKARRILGAAELTVNLESANSPPEVLLLRAAIEAQADLMVIGTHQWHGVGRWVHHSISSGVLRGAAMNVLCVPSPAPLQHGAGRYPKVRCVLAATDFSLAGDQAISWAYAVLPAGGMIRLVHVLPPWKIPSPLVTRYEPRRQTHGGYRRAAADARKKLEALIPPDAMTRGITSDVEVVSASAPARAIEAAADRFGADLLCVGSKGRGAMANAILGSVAQALVERSARPVILVRAMRP